MTNKVLTAKYSISIFFLPFVFFTFHGPDTVTKAMILLISEIQLLTLLNAVHEMGLLTVFILQSPCTLCPTTHFLFTTGYLNIFYT